MKTVYLTHCSEAASKEVEPCVLAVGFFDGVHIGHRTVIDTAKQIASERKVKSAVLTFFPHPKEIISNGTEKVDYLIPFDRKKELIAQLSIDCLYVIHFDLEFAKLDPQSFVKQYLIGLGAVHVVAGFDFTYGYRGQGTMDTMVQDSRGLLDVSVVPKISWKNKKISSTLIRDLLRNGEVSLIPPVLGDYYETFGRISSIRTERSIEITPYDRFMLPAPGIYEVEVETGEMVYQGISCLTESHNGSKHLEILSPSDLKTLTGTTVKIKWLKQRSKYHFNYCLFGINKWDIV
ncbi:hypothetical protein AA0X95_16790 [Bacillus sp. 1P10SD]|uniref:hypothetical protein n=1 Tax=Bacillus sp. 1P10SD TaxID=3132265 RepID=UPI0039A5DD2D